MRAASLSAPLTMRMFGNLAAEMEVQELEAVLHAVRLQLVEALPHFGDRQAELRAVAARRLPAAAAARGQLHAHADLRPHADLARVLEDQAELGVFLDDRDDAAAHLVGQHRHLDELGVLEPVADDRRVVGRHRDDGEQLRLGAGLEAEVVRPAEVEHFLDDLPLLVHLDRIDAEVLAVVLSAARSPPETRRGCRRAAAAGCRGTGSGSAGRCRAAAGDRRAASDRSTRSGSFVACTRTWPFGADGEVALAPAIDFVELGGVGDRPRIALPPRARDTARRTHAANHKRKTL